MMKQNRVENHKQHSTPAINKWVQQAGIAGFAFFFVKGLAWIAIAVWAIN